MKYVLRQSSEVWLIKGIPLIQDLKEALKDYLQQRGINQQFAADIITFYQNFEHHNYVNNFLAGLDKFLTN